MALIFNRLFTCMGNLSNKSVSVLTKQIFNGVLLLAITPAVAQTTDTTREISLQEVVVKAYEMNRKLKDIPAAVNYVGRSALERFSPVSVVQAINTTPGVRMEERSPGSYRFNIRGSSLRSPFGVRNVKVYYNDIPFTDPGGHTYLNQLGYYNFNHLEVIKGPGSSLYGAGTGGVILIESLGADEQPGVFAEYATGSYGLHNMYGSITTVSEKLVSRAGFQHQQSSGYRNHSQLKRDVFNWNGTFRFTEKHSLKATFLYGKLFYETPGALTQSEFEQNPRSARPGNAIFPGAEEADASITQKMFLAGASYSQHLTSWLQNKSVLYGMFTDLRNPTIQNYGHSSEPHVGGRTVFRASKRWKEKELAMDFGGEWQEGYTSVSIHKNARGNADSLRTYDQIQNRQAVAFTHASLDFDGWSVTAGASLNFLRVRLERFNPVPSGLLRRKYSNEIAPRLALMKKLGAVNVYASMAKGFSPPTTEELAPTGGELNLGLNAENGINYDIGLKGAPLKDLYVDVNAFLFALSKTIVQRRTAGGGSFYINAGKTRQYGVETYVSYPVLQKALFIDRSLFWLSHTWHRFRYREFKQVDNDFSGNALPAVGPQTLSTGIDFLARNGFLGALSYYYSDRVPLNDANSIYADAYHLLGIKAGYQKWMKGKFRIKLIAGIENLLDQNYSLGNDVNGFGGRYFNAAAGRNYYASLVFQLLTRKAGLTEGY